MGYFLDEKHFSCFLYRFTWNFANSLCIPSFNDARNAFAAAYDAPQLIAYAIYELLRTIGGALILVFTRC